MAATDIKNYKLLVRIAQDQNNVVQAYEVQQGAGARGQTLKIQAQKGAKYQLQELDKPNQTAPQYVKTKRVGKNLVIMFENDDVPDIIIENYYDDAIAGTSNLVGQAENGGFYDYIPEDPEVAGTVGSLSEGGDAVNVALGGVDEELAADNLAIFGAPLLLGALGAGGAAAAYSSITGSGTNNDPVTGKPLVTGALDGSSDTGIIGDNKTNDKTPTLSGKVPAGSTASVVINGVKYPVTVNPDGTWSFTQPTDLPDGTYTPILEVTDSTGATTNNALTPFTIDTIPPTIAVSSNLGALAAGQTAIISFTLSEVVNDFTLADIAVTGGTLSGFAQSATDPKVYTAIFTPSGTGTSATISVASNKFSDGAGNLNADGADINNSVTLTTSASTPTISGALDLSSDSGTIGDNKTNDREDK